MKRVFKVALATPIDGKKQATVTIEPTPGRPGEFYFTVRPKGKRSYYKLTLSTVAEIVVWRIAKLEASSRLT